MKRILVTGGGGQVGIELSRVAWPDDVVIDAPDRAALDIGSARSIDACFSATSYDAIVNCAAFTAVDQAEKEVAAAFRANAVGPAGLADVARQSAIPLIQLSTDYVFDGYGDRAYEEDDQTAPLGVYGASKRAGELAVLSGAPRSLVLRTAWVVSAHRSNFLKTMLRIGSVNPRLRVVADQHGCPTAAADIAGAVRMIVLKMIEDLAAPAGIYHFVNSGEASWHDLALEIFRLRAKAGRPVPQVDAIETADYPTPARRPANSRLSTRKLARDYGIRPRGWTQAVADIVAELTAAEKLPQQGEF